jgi:hypothetical protein
VLASGIVLEKYQQKQLRTPTFHFIQKDGRSRENRDIVSYSSGNPAIITDLNVNKNYNVHTAKGYYRDNCRKVRVRLC